MAVPSSETRIRETPSSKPITIPNEGIPRRRRGQVEDGLLLRVTVSSPNTTSVVIGIGYQRRLYFDSLMTLDDFQSDDRSLQPSI